jgi:hypothetical protein
MGFVLSVVKVAEFAANLNIPICNSFSEVYEVLVNELPAIPTLSCWETAAINEATCSWDISGTQPPEPFTECWETAIFNNNTCLWEITGVKPEVQEIACRETVEFNNNTCSWEVSGVKPVTIFQEAQILCDNAIELLATTNFETPEFLWSTAETTVNISVNTPGIYSVNIFDGDCSFVTIVFYVERP